MSGGPTSSPHTRLTYQWNPVGRGWQNFIQDELQHGDGEQHGDLEAELLASFVGDQERGQVQTQEEQDGQQKVDNVEDRPPPHGDLRRDGEQMELL